LLLLSGCASGILSTSRLTATNVSLQENTGTNDNAIITTYVGGVPHSQMISYASGVYLKELFSKLATANAHDPCSAETQQLQRQILIFAEEQGLLPPGMSADMVFTQLGKRGQSFAPQSIGDGSSVYTAGIGREMFCNFVATGEGAAFPIIILPRFIPFIMAPIPRLFVGWKTALGVTSCGGLLSGTGFYAVGPQQGFALGFWGIGFSIFLPPVMAYGMFGYALFAKATAEYMEYYPPNNPPEITQTDPANGEQMVSIATTELRFDINDPDNDLMSYNVTTDPDIGSGSGGLKPSGTYSIPVSGLQDLTTYTWHVKVTDGKDTTEKTITFTTEAIAPIVSNPLPKDNALFVPIETSNLSFDLKDYQGDLMDWTVETQPDIGSGGAIGIGDGRYTIIISGLDYFTSYTWFVNVTDGEHWMKKTYIFRTISENTLVLEPIDDTAIMENHPNDNCGTSEEIALRSLSGWEWDLLFKFDLSVIPSNVTIQDASLQAYYYKNWDGNPGGHHVNLYRISSNWNEDTVTWATQPSYVTELSSFALIPSTIEKWILWDATDDVMMFYNSGTPNYGWRMVDISGGNQCSYLRSKEYSAYHPVLIIGYDPYK
jgi:hypothetical protein